MITYAQLYQPAFDFMDEISVATTNSCDDFFWAFVA
jgi:hypothetical protein